VDFPDRNSETAWLAGLLEGEGTFFRVKKGHSVGIHLGMCDEDTVRCAAGIMDCKVWYDRNRSHKNGKGYWVAYLGSQKAMDVMNRVLPFMHSRRSARIRELLDLASRRLSPRQISARALAARGRFVRQRCPRTSEMFGKD
jgi:hypothetical protein